MHTRIKPGFLALVAAMALLLMQAGCAALEGYMSGASKPTVSLQAARVDKLGLDRATMVFDLKITNPYGVPLPLTDLAYGLSTNGRQFLSGNANVAGVVDANASRVVSLPVDVIYTQAISAGAGIKPGTVVPYAAELVMSLQPPAGMGMDKLEFPLRKEGNLAIPVPPKVELTDLRWESLTLTRAQALMKVKITNPNSFAINLTKMETGLSLAGTRVGSAGMEKALKLAENSGTNQLDLPIGFSPMDFGVAFFKMLSGSSTGYDLDYTLQGQTPGGPLLLSNKSSGVTSMK